MDHGVRDFNAGGKRVEDKPACLLLEKMNELTIGGKVFFIAEDGGGEVALESFRGAEKILRRFAIHQQSVGTEDLFAKSRRDKKLIEADRKDLRSCLKTGSGFGLTGLGSKWNFLGAGFGCAVVFAGDAGGEQGEGLRFPDQRFQLLKKS